MKVFLLLLTTALTSAAAAQQAATDPQLSARFLPALSARMDKVHRRLEHNTRKALAALYEREERLQQKLAHLDTAAAKDMVTATHLAYNRLQQQLTITREAAYLSSLDTFKTALLFRSGSAGLPGREKEQYTQAMDRVAQAEQSLGRAEAVQRFMAERTVYLQQHLKGLPLTRELKRLNKGAYYYTARLSQYRQELSTPAKVERRALAVLRQTKGFSTFMQHNSRLASLFRPAGSEAGEGLTGTFPSGLQTGAAVRRLIAARGGSLPDGGGTADYLARQVQEAATQLASLKKEVARYKEGSYGSTGVKGAGFRPNPERAKPFAKRLVWGGSVQTQRGSRYFPVTTDIGVSVGYRLSGRSVAGVGVSGKAGLGSGWEHVRLSYGGVGLRSYVEYRGKGSLFASGGYEQHYRRGYADVGQLQGYRGWQRSSLLGMGKRYRVSGRVEGSVRLLWDFMSYQQVPKAQPLLFRIGYHLK